MVAPLAPSNKAWPTLLIDVRHVCLSHDAPLRCTLDNGGGGDGQRWSHDSQFILYWAGKGCMIPLTCTVELGEWRSLPRKLIDGEVGEIVKVQKGRGARGRPVFDVKVADKIHAKVQPSAPKPAA